MARRTAFEWISEQLEERTSFNRLEARGTVRLALRAAGLEGDATTPAQMDVVLEQILPGELEKRGIEDAAFLCGDLRRRLPAVDLDAPEAVPTPEDIFSRMA